MIRMLIVGYYFGIRSERRRRRVPNPGVSLVLSAWARWRRPDHSTFSKNRHGRFRQGDLLRRLFAPSCGAASARAWSAAKALRSMPLDQGGSKPAEGYRGRERASAGLSDAPSRSILADLDDAAFGAATEVTPNLSRRPIRRPAGPEPMRASLLRLLHQLSDRCRQRVIVDVEATTAIRQAEVLAAKRMIRPLDGTVRPPPAKPWATVPMARWPICSVGSSISTASSRM